MRKLLLLLLLVGSAGSSQIVNVDGVFDAGCGLGEAVVPVESFLTDEAGDRLTDEAGNYFRNE